MKTLGIVIMILVIVALAVVVIGEYKSFKCGQVFEGYFPDGISTLTLGILLSTDAPRGTIGHYIQDCIRTGKLILQ